MLLLTACSRGPSKELMDNCKKLNEQLLKFSSEIEIPKVDDGYIIDISLVEKGYLTTNTGDATRSRIKESLLRKFPSLSSELEQVVNSPYSSNLFTDELKMKLFREAIKGTGFEIALGDNRPIDEQIINIVGDDYYEPNQPLTGCAIVFDFIYENDEDYDLVKDNTPQLWNGYLASFSSALDAMEVINSCSKTGKWESDVCAKKDYIDNATYEVPTPVNPWSKNWSTKKMEMVAKTVWCINHGYRNYVWSQDKCTNDINR